MNIREKVKDYTDTQLDAVIEVLESIDIEGWNTDLLENSTCSAPWHVTTLLGRAKAIRETRTRWWARRDFQPK